MKASRLLLCSIVLVFAASLASAQSLVTVYSHDFQTPVGSEWSDYDRETTPVGLRTFLGRFGGEPVYLDLTNLPDHCAVTVSFELFIIGSWEGSVGYYAGPDLWDLNAASPSSCCPEVNLLHATFANCDCRYQSYPDTYPHVHHAGLTGADEVDTLGYEHDSVYYLSFSFFHNQPELRLSFAGTPALQGILDEAWGIDNIVVQADTSGRNCCRATRTLPEGYSPGVDAPVSIAITPNPRSEVHVVEETTPAGWAISNISDGGVFDQDSRIIRWGPFFDDVGRTVSYWAQPGPSASSTAYFRGTITVDGETEAICGDEALDLGSYHPADVDEDWVISSVELTAYGAAWKNGDGWATGPTPIPADFVTIAGLIWKDGGGYHFDAAVSPPWVPAGGKLAGGGSVTGVFGSSAYRAGHALSVNLSVTPDDSTLSYLVSEVPPAGWTVGAISDGGRWDVTTHSVKWGPYFDSSVKTLSYTVTPPEGTTGLVTFMGEASFNGDNVLVAGARSISPISGPMPEDTPVTE